MTKLVYAALAGVGLSIVGTIVIFLLLFRAESRITSLQEQVRTVEAKTGKMAQSLSPGPRALSLEKKVEAMEKQIHNQKMRAPVSPLQSKRCLPKSTKP